MANKIYKDLAIKLDSSTAVLTAITSWTNQASLQAAMDVIEDSALNTEERTYAPGLAGATVQLNGFVNSTTDGIFGPLVGNRTSLTKTVEWYNGLKYYNGEAYPTDTQYSGNVNDMQTWSCTLTFTGAINRTSVAL